MENILYKAIPLPLLENLLAAFDHRKETSEEFKASNKRDKYSSHRIEYSYKTLTLTIKDIFNYLKFSEPDTQVDNLKYKMINVPKELLDILFSAIEISKEKGDKFFDFEGPKKESKLLEDEYDKALENEKIAMRDLYIYLKYIAQIESQFNDDPLVSFNINTEEFYK